MRSTADGLDHHLHPRHAVQLDGVHGVVGAMISTTVSGKVIAMWMPIMLFFAMTFEHSVVNMFLFPRA